MPLDATNPNLTPANIKTRRLDVLDVLLQLRNINDGAETTDAEETPIELKVEKLGPSAIIINSAGSSGTVDGSNFWTVEVEVADNLGFTNPTSVLTQVLGAGSEEFYYAIDGYMLETIRTAGEDESLYIRSKLTETGTTATDATYGAYIVPC